MQRYLYHTLIEDSAHLNGRPFMSMEQQIQDLIDILMHPQWLDFSNPRNQVVAKWFDSPDQRKKQDFFHQLLLSVELYLRIQSPQYNGKYKRKLILELHPVVAWDLAVAQRWLDNMSITKKRESKQQSTFSFQLKSKGRQREALRKFAEILKWPNMDEVEYILDEEDVNERALEDRSADAMSWFSGIILPGRTLPWLIMNSLIDCDRDTGVALKYLTHMQPASGFQYRANTYWSASCIVGKVLGAARGVKQVAGWVGPCIFTPDLKRTECVKVKQYESPDPRLTEHDVISMDERTSPLGPIDETYPVDDYEVPMPDTEDVTDLIRVEKLAFLPAEKQPSSTKNLPGAPMLFDAAIHFACGGSSWPLRLKYDVSFINAFPCHQGPHGKYSTCNHHQHYVLTKYQFFSTTSPTPPKPSTKASLTCMTGARKAVVSSGPRLAQAPTNWLLINQSQPTNRSRKCWLLRRWASVITRSLPERGARIMGSVLWWPILRRLVWLVRSGKRTRLVLVWSFSRKGERRGRVILERAEGRC